MKITRPGTHTMPMPWHVALSLAWWIAGAGYPRVAGLLLLQAATGMRPSEVLALVKESLVPPALNRAGANCAVIILGIRRRTKSGRRQFITVSRSISPIAVKIIEVFFATTPAGAYLSNCVAYTQYYSILKRATTACHLVELKFTPHSPRAGWATESRMGGMPFQEIKELGRWDSDKALRIYLDASAALLASVSCTHIDHIAAYLAEDFAKRFPWWP